MLSRARTSEMIRDTIIKNDVSHRVEKLEKNQVYILDTGTHFWYLNS